MSYSLTQSFSNVSHGTGHALSSFIIRYVLVTGVLPTAIA